MSDAADVGKIELVESDAVRGFLHRPAQATGQGLVLTHGAGSDCNAPLLVAVANAFSAAGLIVLRCDLAFRQQRPKGPPFPAGAAADRESLRNALTFLREITSKPLFLGGHSYGGRQASMLVAEEPDLAAALLLLSYPLHPPNKPAQLRTEHFSKLRTRRVFVSGTTDSFGSPAELEKALSLPRVRPQLLLIEGAGHDLKRGRFDLAPVVSAFLAEAKNEG
jgi:predicted alpha/beta-hydrolase family hydrolase